MGQQGRGVSDLSASPLRLILSPAELVHSRAGGNQAPRKISKQMGLGWVPASAGSDMDLK